MTDYVKILSFALRFLVCMNKFLELLLQNVNNLLNLLTPVYYCNAGFNIIRNTFGVPGKLYDIPGICFKIPIIQSFDVVNVKKQVHFLNAHSVKSKNDKLIPYNITVDAQVEFRILDPYIIYKIDMFDDANREPIRIYVDNEVHLILNEFIQNESISAIEMQKIINDKLLQRNNSPQDYFQKAILIDRIVISAFDYNLSLRHAQ